ncbi:hypothetical protein GCM10009677_10700 [Sphaerisporangium rubeum]|uniref:Uncharacterized protein n=1 Tax=Sphaerisporangium rubeum TaxID=321317 RepID=A0A7X0M5K9_9ACTN|nr:hypothetical protein [Sphaerisporangium rubeum]MBB6472307.1 hypothetical protein [Sphaerisporangium rubeum]
MEEHRTKRRPYGEPVRPPRAQEQEEGLPPSARVYGAPSAPSGIRLPLWAERLAVLLGSVAAGVTVVALVVSTVVSRVNAPDTTRLTVSDGLAGVTYLMPPGWRAGAVPPVTGFTSAAVYDGSAIVMTRPGDPVAVSGPRAAALSLTELYARLLLHGDTVDTVDDRPVETGGYTGHSRALRAGYSDVVNRPAYLRVTVLAKDGADTSVVIVGMVQPDDPRRRAEIDGMLALLK